MLQTKNIELMEILVYSQNSNDSLRIFNSDSFIRNSKFIKNKDSYSFLLKKIMSRPLIHKDTLNVGLPFIIDVLKKYNLIEDFYLSNPNKKGILNRITRYASNRVEDYQALAIALEKIFLCNLLPEQLSNGFDHGLLDRILPRNTIENSAKIISGVAEILLIINKLGVDSHEILHPQREDLLDRLNKLSIKSATEYEIFNETASTIKVMAETGKYNKALIYSGSNLGIINMLLGISEDLADYYLNFMKIANLVAEYNFSFVEMMEFLKYISDSYKIRDFFKVFPRAFPEVMKDYYCVNKNKIKDINDIYILLYQKILLFKYNF